MRIAIDAHTFATDEMTGGDVYVLNLVREFAGTDGDDTFVIMLNAMSRRASMAAVDRLSAAARECAGPIGELRFDFARSRLPSRLPERLFNAWYYRVTAPRMARKHEVDAFFGANFYCVTSGPWRKAVKIHDVAPLVCPEFTHPAMFSRFRRDMRRQDSQCRGNLRRLLTGGHSTGPAQSSNLPADVPPCRDDWGISRRPASEYEHHQEREKRRDVNRNQRCRPAEPVFSVGQQSPGVSDNSQVGPAGVETTTHIGRGLDR